MTIHSKVLVAAAVAAGFIAMPGVAAASQSQLETIVVMGGAIKDPANAQYAKAPEDKSVPALPVVYEAAPASPQQAAPVNSKAPS